MNFTHNTVEVKEASVSKINKLYVHHPTNQTSQHLTRGAVLVAGVGAAKPTLVCHCWTDKTDGCCANKTGRGTNKTGAASVFDSANNAADSAARVAEDDKNTNSRCRKLFDFDTKKGVCAGNTITKVRISTSDILF